MNDNELAFDLANLHSFGDLAAEDDAVLDYFLKTEAVQRIQSNEVLLALGSLCAGGRFDDVGE
jgi:hypothetical protein